MSNTSNAGATGGTRSGYEAAADAWQGVLDGNDADTNEDGADEHEDEQDEGLDEGTEDGDSESDGDGEGTDGDEGDDDGQEGEPDEGDEGDGDGDDEDPVYSIRVDGQNIAVPLSELVKGYSRTADYTRKTQAVAQQRQEVEAFAQQVFAQGQNYVQRLQQVEQLLQATEPNWEELKRTDPIEYAAQWASHQQRQAALQQVRDEQQRVQQQIAGQQQHQMMQQVAQARQWLLTQVPEWRDEKVRKAEQAAMKQFGQQLGYTDAELSQVIDPRAVIALRMAMRYANLQAKGQQLKGKAGKVKLKAPAATSQPKPSKGPVKVMRPGAAKPAIKRTQGDLTKAKTTLAKTGTVKAAANYFEKLLG